MPRVQAIDKRATQYHSAFVTYYCIFDRQLRDDVAAASDTDDDDATDNEYDDLAAGY